MACFLIDYENVNCRVLEGISLIGLKEEDEIILFYSKGSNRITMQLHRELEQTPAKKFYIETETGTRNSLDFQLATWLGACIHKNPRMQYYIVSKDRGYDCVCHFWNNINIHVKRIEYLNWYADINNQFI